ncbi:lytic transglycosylase domain-containing protein [Streptomyces sp. NPDC048409]|uniref:lytic transglycosylase domain-containing protein n=1 Tax=Streptomyces sp. NPDC048409 TaxID=3154723 RepID=UPI00343FFB54
MAAGLQRATQTLTVLAVTCAVTAAVVGTRHTGSDTDPSAVGSQSFERPVDGGTLVGPPSAGPTGTPSPNPTNEWHDDTDGPTANPWAPDDSPPTRVPGTDLTLPAAFYRAYHDAESAQQAQQPGCRLHWQLLAGIGQVESGQGHDGAVDSTGTMMSPLYGPLLDGGSYPAIVDTDGGVLDGDDHFDRAVGPMQFVPGTWRVWGADGNGDHVADPQNIYDAAISTARYLCADDRDLSRSDDLNAAVLSYNHSQAYADTVLQWMSAYAGGQDVLPSPSPSPSVSSSVSPSVSPSSSVSPAPSGSTSPSPSSSVSSTPPTPSGA